MSSAHVGHDCVLEDNITLCNHVALAGHVRIMLGNVSVKCISSSVQSGWFLGNGWHEYMFK